MRTLHRVLLAGGAAAVVGTSGSAYTDSNTLTDHDSTVGYVVSSISGAVVSNVKHSLSNDGKTITSSQLTFTTDLKPSAVVKAAFGAGSAPALLESCNLVQGTAGAADVATCPSSAGYATTTANHFAVSVS